MQHSFCAPIFRKVKDYLFVDQCAWLIFILFNQAPFLIFGAISGLKIYLPLYQQFGQF